MLAVEEATHQPEQHMPRHGLPAHLYLLKLQSDMMAFNGA